MGIHIFPVKDAKGNIVTNKEPFDSKAVPNGSLFRRKHGFVFSSPIPVGSSAIINLVVPYDSVKINELELINCKEGDAVDLKVLDTPQGHIQISMGVPPESITPSLMLNQFGFNVQLPAGFYRDVSNYDADLIKDMVVQVEYFNNGSQPITPIGNIVWHEIK